MARCHAHVTCPRFKRFSICLRNERLGQTTLQAWLRIPGLYFHLVTDYSVFNHPTQPGLSAVSLVSSYRSLSSLASVSTVIPRKAKHVVGLTVWLINRTPNCAQKCTTTLSASWPWGGVLSHKDNEVIQVVVNMLHHIYLDVPLDCICNGIKYLGGRPQSKGQHFVYED